MDGFMSVKARNATCRASEKLLFHHVWLVEGLFSESVEGFCIHAAEQRSSSHQLLPLANYTQYKAKYGYLAFIMSEIVSSYAIITEEKSQEQNIQEGREPPKACKQYRDNIQTTYTSKHAK